MVTINKKHYWQGILPSVGHYRVNHSFLVILFKCIKNLSNCDVKTHLPMICYFITTTYKLINIEIIMSREKIIFLKISSKNL